MDDPELAAMAAIVEAFVDLEDQARARVIRWATDKYALHVVSKSTDNNRVNETASSSANINSDPASAPPVTASKFNHFAELFDATSPKTEAQKALIAAYWVQVINEAPQFTASNLTKELKNLGHSIGNITRALSNNQDKKPSLVIQLGKSGKTRSSHKTYKLTTEGIKSVDSMMRGS